MESRICSLSRPVRARKTAAAVNRALGWKSGRKCGVRADCQATFPSKTDPMMSPAIAPIMVVDPVGRPVSVVWFGCFVYDPQRVKPIKDRTTADLKNADM